jgi:MFS family permease
VGAELPSGAGARGLEVDDVAEVEGAASDGRGQEVEMRNPTRDSGLAAMPARLLAHRLGCGFLLVAFTLSMWAYYWRLDNYPPYFDYDSSSLGIFVNNLTFHDRYDYFFERSPVEQDRYRQYWAAHFLPASTVMSAVQTLLGIPADRVDALLKGFTLFFGLIGCLCAAAAVGCFTRRRWAEVLFLVGFTAALPSFLLYLRTGVAHFLFSFFAFWLAVWLIVRFVEWRRPRDVWLLGLVLACYALVPYVPLVTLPLVGLLLVLRWGALRPVLGNWHLYAAALFCVAIFGSLRYAVAVGHEESYDAWQRKATAFVDTRSRYAMSLDALSTSKLPEKVAKLTNQHFLFSLDKLGDRTRKDDLWTLDTPHLVWVALLPLVGFGAWRGWRERDRGTDVAGSVLLTGLMQAFTVGMPEGRYLLTVVPCYVYFLLVGVRVLARAPGLREAALGLAMLATAGNSYLLVQGNYNDGMIWRWEQMGGMRESLALIRSVYGDEYASDRDIYLNWPDLRYEPWLYLQMLGNLRVLTYDDTFNLAEIAPGEPLFAVTESSDEDTLRAWRSRGFRSMGTVVDAVSGRQYVVLDLAP